MSPYLFFAFGVLLLHQLVTLPQLLGVHYLLLACTLMLGFWRAPRLRWLWMMAIGFLWALYYGQTQLEHRLDPALEGQNIQLTGIVASIPKQTRNDYRFEFHVETVDALTPFPQLLRITWYRSQHVIKAGQRWRLTVRLKRPHGFLNPGGFDYEGWLFTRGIHATGYVRAAKDNAQQPVSGLRAAYHGFRQALYDKLQTHTQSLPYAGVLTALLLGERQGLSEAQKDVLLATGTQHLIAISGLHIGMIAGVLFFLTRRLWSLSPRATLWVPAPKAAALAAMLGAVTYAALAGFSIPTQRALIMLTMVMLSLLTRRWLPTRRIFAMALAAVLALQPSAVISAGFWLSFAAVALILLIAREKYHRWLTWARVQLWLSIGLIPLTIVFFQQFSVVSPLANAVAIPVFSLLIVPLVFLAAVTLWLLPVGAMWCLSLADSVLSILWLWLTWLGQWGAVAMPPVSTGALVCVVAGYLYWMLGKGVPLRHLGLLGFLLLFFPQTDAPPQGEVRVTVLDVGQGLATVVRTRRHTLVFDTGPRFSRTFDAGSAVVLPYLRATGVDTLDMVMISHGDNDHKGGLDALLQHLPITTLVTGEPMRLQAQATVCHRGQQWVWDDVVFRVLSPPLGATQRGNNRSCVVRIQAREKTVLLTGDIEASIEKQLIETQADALDVDLLVAPHHGSLTSSTPAFVAHTKPAVVIFATGYRNRYGFPKPQVRERYARGNVTFYNTATHGAITLTSRHKDWEISTYRAQAGGFWH